MNFKDLVVASAEMSYLPVFFHLVSEMRSDVVITSVNREFRLKRKLYPQLYATHIPVSH